MANLQPHTSISERKITPEFSLFDEDNLNRIFSALGFRSQGAARIVFRSAALILVAWVPAFLLSLIDHVTLRAAARESFLCDIAGYGQTFIGYPMFLIAELIVNKKTKRAAHIFLHSGILPSHKFEQFLDLHKKVKQYRTSFCVDLICISLAYLFSFLWIGGELHNEFQTWHALGPAGNQVMTWAGMWAAFIGVPLLNYWWLRWMHRIIIWCWYLHRVTKNRLRVIATHPDKTGGLGFVSEAQTSFGAAIFAFGCSIIAATIIHKIKIEGADFSDFSMWGPALGFVIGAPLMFVLPLLMFTKHLARAKRRAKELFDHQASEAALVFEQQWLIDHQQDEKSQILGGYLSGISNLTRAYEIVESMRVVPFDTRSFFELVGSAVGPILFILPYLGHVPKPVIEILEMLKK